MQNNCNWSRFIFGGVIALASALAPPGAYAQNYPTKPIRMADELARLVRSCIPFNPKVRIDPATRTFQGLRIAVNQELHSLDLALQRLPSRLKPGGRLAIISFHSLEDRRVKEAFRENLLLEVLTKKPLTAQADELSSNPRSRSAKLRVAQRALH